MARLPFDGPYPLTQGFGEHPLWYERYNLPGHNGRDYGTPRLTPILAPADGEVTERGYDRYGYGHYVKLRTPAGEDWLLAHLLHECGYPEGTWLAAGAFVSCAG